MAMCSTCQGLYNQYSSLKGQLSNAQEQTSNCNSATTSMQKTFTNVVIGGYSIDNDFSGKMLSHYGVISGNLSAMIAQCQQEMNRIESACPGPSHYDYYNS